MPPLHPGTVRVLLYAGGMNDDDVTTMLDGAAEKASATFVLSVLEGPDRGRSVAVTDGLFVGKSEACELPLTDPKVSRRHAQMTHEGAYLRLRDTGSTNGTYADKPNGCECQVSAIGAATNDSESTADNTAGGMLSLANRSRSHAPRPRPTKKTARAANSARNG